MVDSQTGNNSVTYNSALYILNCTNVAIRNITVQRSNGTGLSMYDTNGTVLIADSHFQENYIRASKSTPLVVLALVMVVVEYI